MLYEDCLAVAKLFNQPLPKPTHICYKGIIYPTKDLPKEFIQEVERIMGDQREDLHALRKLATIEGKTEQQEDMETIQHQQAKDEELFGKAPGLEQAQEDLAAYHELTKAPPPTTQDYVTKIISIFPQPTRKMRRIIKKEFRRQLKQPFTFRFSSSAPSAEDNMVTHTFTATVTLPPAPTQPAGLRDYVDG